MSWFIGEYQYCEWQTIDRPLTEKEIDAVNGLSSHIDVTASQAVVTYSWGNFKHDPKQVLAQYFDAHLYLANWGSRRLMFRFPKGQLEQETIKPYCLAPHISYETVGNYQILDLGLSEQEGGDWVEGSGWLSSFTRLRDDLVQGDYRLLYLAWLKAITLSYAGEVEALTEPPVPAGLDKLSGSLNRFIEFVELDSFLVEVAAAASTPLQPAPDTDFRALIGRLSRSECDDYLFRFVTGETGALATLKKKLMSFVTAPAPANTSARRTADQLLEAMEQRQQQERARKAEAAQEKHRQEMEALAKRENEVWQEVQGWLQHTQPKAYEEVTQRLVKLKELAEFRGTQATFQQKVDSLREKYKNRPSLLSRMRQAGLIT